MYRLKMYGGVGKHDLDQVDAKGEATFCEPGQTIVHASPLHERFPDKFMLVEEAVTISAAGKEVPLTSAEFEKLKKPAPKPAPKLEGLQPIDVTDRFPSAATAGLTVLSLAGVFSIKRGDEMVIDGLSSEALVVSEIDDAISVKE